MIFSNCELPALFSDEELDFDEDFTREAPASIAPERFRDMGHRLVDRISGHMSGMRERPVAKQHGLETVREALGSMPLPESGMAAEEVLERATSLLMEHSVMTAHPRFWAYVHGAPSPLGALADFLASAINSPATSFQTGPMASAIEKQAVEWMAELVGFPQDCGGIFLSGGSMATITAVTTALRRKAGWDVRGEGVTGMRGRLLRLYATAQTHSCVRTAADMCGLGESAIHRVPTDAMGRMDPNALAACIELDRRSGLRPFLVVGTAGTTSTGSIDPLAEIAAVCRESDLWFHVDGAYGAVAVVSPDAPEALKGLREADSLALDPHKWMYMPLEAGCLLMRDRHALYDTFCYRADYYSHNQAAPDDALPFRDQSAQTSRGLRALKVWLALQSIGRDGYRQMISDDMALAKRLYRKVAAHPALEALSHSLSITTLRYAPPELAANVSPAYLDLLNERILKRLQSTGMAYPSHTYVDGKYVLRVCIVNHNTQVCDVDALPQMVATLGDALHQEALTELAARMADESSGMLL
ncbi:pyridoxal phosphate-dependent decarboxylase family protein [Haliangium ochraceum]|uniref:Pyridoxal-dependent decarboxylase n=1 Tax=Haliangium ochraceum (strain DSM 14365 / JCM 11303 / SMP-2) TaxID=502025 RepID=D0LJJ0_HALO1|nr:aminotransferase class V-fold PLP-dependent enzyme [Haliangium ochraceum]ACY16564.1 Pyridoxal-dependent decarboxylase [Haliangium ochraceum DSM 14365]